ncbi:MAG: hypothetical protein ABR555_18165 [Pyrinomonadaceae bacterium]
MSDLLNIPLHLFQVLEQEYVNLYGPDAKLGSLTVELTDANEPAKRRCVVANLDWLFDETHIKNANQFGRELLRYASPPEDASRSCAVNVHTADWVKENLSKYLLSKISKNCFALIAANTAGEPATAPVGLVTALTTDLNTILDDSHLYQPDRFSSNWLGTASRSLICEYESPETFKGDDLRHFNRLLLEDAFPAYLEKVNNIRLAAMFKTQHKIQPKALCLSGGGIRSGTFSLGILQGLARYDLLGGFNYLSTVSGGGYIGSWLTAWIHRHPNGLAGVTAELANSDPKTKIDPDPTPIRYLRKYSNFITPRVGLLTADTWTFIGIYLRNLFLNWLVFIPLILAVLMLPRLVVTLTMTAQDTQFEWTVTLLGYSAKLYGRYILLAAGFLLGVWALAYMIFNRPGLREELRQRSHYWRSRSTQRGFLIYCLLPLVLSGFCLTTYWAWSPEAAKLFSLPFMSFFGAAFTFLGWLIATATLGRVLNPERRKNVSGSDLARLVAAGFVGGTLLWLVSRLHNVFDSPILGMDRRGLSWTVWSGWTNWTTELYACFAVPAFLLVFLAGATFFVGVSSVSPTVDDEDREWWARLGAWVLIAIIAWCAATTLVIYGPIVLLSAPRLLVPLGGVSGLLAVLLGHSSRTPATEQNAKQKTTAKPRLLSSLLSRALPLLALIFLAAFLAFLSIVTSTVFEAIAVFARNHPTTGVNDWLTNLPRPGFTLYINYISDGLSAVSGLQQIELTHMNVVHHTSSLFVLAVGLVLFVFGLGLSRAINLNLFSLHAGYRNRLIRAFLGASRPDHERKPNPFTGFDPADNINMHELRPNLFDEDDLIDPVGIAAALRNRDNELSRYLAGRDLLKNINSLPSVTTPSPRLIATLRTDLNRVLQDKDLAKQNFVQTLLKSGKGSGSVAQLPAVAEIVSNGAAHNGSSILTNRSVLESAYPNMFRQRSLTPATFKLMPVINTTLNLVGGENLAWQQRKAEPFTITPLHSGCFRVGYRSSREYGGSETGGISLGTAATISGAAASSNMGYYTTSPLLSLVLTLFNVRLGWWLGNPGPAGETTYYLRAPKYSVAPVIDEALGMTDDQNKYVYLTDGGHFENLAIYEMVLRRCHLIVACDGAQDPEYHFTDLGNAIRKIRIDLGIPIEFFSMPIFASWPDNTKRGLYWAIAKIRYSCIDGDNVKDGLLLYIKPAVYGDEPRDVLEYKKSFPAFPHQSTADQFFDESQFESYRVLGSHVMDQLCNSTTGGNVFNMIRAAVDNTVALKKNDELRKWADAWLTRDK